jgi:hypothetical protein
VRGTDTRAVVFAPPRTLRRASTSTSMLTLLVVSPGGSVNHSTFSPSPLGRALAGRRAAVTERSEGNPRSGLTAARRSAALAVERGRGRQPRSDELRLRFTRGYVVDLDTGEILSSVIADIRRDRARS